ncbi:MAG TPA: DUF998 domain-containing protein [Ktedonobacterales bacterium]
MNDYTTISTPVSANSQIARSGALLSAILAALSLALLAALHILSPELDPSWRMVSEYALGQYGWVLSLMFLTMALSCVTLSVVMMPQTRTRGGKIGLGFLLAASVGMAMASVFDITQGLHGLAVLIGNTSFPVAAILLSLSLVRANPAWFAIRRPLLWLANFPWISLVLMLALLFIGLSQTGGKFGPEVWIGWPNRILLVAYGAWLIAVAVRAARVSHGKTRPDPAFQSTFVG